MMWTKLGNIFSKHHAQVPVVDEYESFYRVYYSTRIQGKSNPLYLDLNKNNLTEILYESEIPILNLGAPGYFDNAGIMPTDLVTYNEVKYLYYIGWSLRKDVPYHNTLGLAISEDGGNSWNKFSSGPIIGSSYKEPGYIGTVDILIENDIWKMWYLSCRDWIEYNGVMEPTYDIKYASSKNGIDWNIEDITCIPLLGDEGGISAARVIKMNNKYKMWFSVRNKINYRENIKDSYRIKEAVSDDGIIWNRENNLISLDISEDPWENVMVCYPEVIKKSNKLIMFYNGNGFGKTGIGIATSTIE